MFYLSCIFMRLVRCIQKIVSQYNTLHRVSLQHHSSCTNLLETPLQLDLILYQYLRKFHGMPLYVLSALSLSHSYSAFKGSFPTINKTLFIVPLCRTSDRRTSKQISSLFTIFLLNFPSQHIWICEHYFSCKGNRAIESELFNDRFYVCFVSWRIAPFLCFCI